MYGQVYAVTCGDVTYVGATMQNSTTRWVDHMWRLKNGRHHCKKLQEQFADITDLKFSVLEDGIDKPSLTKREYYWSKKLDSANQWPRSHLRADISKAIRTGMTYREISRRYRVSVGMVGNTKRSFNDAVQKM
jgi:hypothetical protein